MDRAERTRLYRSDMLDLAILGLLREAAMHGYELKRQLSMYGFWQVSFGSLYPALRRLERDGFIEADPGDGRKRTFHITADGEARFRKLLLDESNDVDEDRAFQLRLAFFRYLDTESRLSVLERRRARLIARVNTASESLKESGARARERLDQYAIALMRRGVSSAKSDLKWVDELIEAEKKSE